MQKTLVKMEEIDVYEEYEEEETLRMSEDELEILQKHNTTPEQFADLVIKVHNTFISSFMWQLKTNPQAKHITDTILGLSRTRKEIEIEIPTADYKKTISFLQKNKLITDNKSLTELGEMIMWDTFFSKDFLGEERFEEVLQINKPLHVPTKLEFVPSFQKFLGCITDFFATKPIVSNSEKDVIRECTLKDYIEFAVKLPEMIQIKEEHIVRLEDEAYVQCVLLDKVRPRSMPFKFWNRDELIDADNTPSKKPQKQFVLFSQSVCEYVLKYLEDKQKKSCVNCTHVQHTTITKSIL